MVEHDNYTLDATFSALAHPTRRVILQRLTEGDQRVTELAGAYSISLAAVSKHIQVLERAGLVRRRVSGREHRLSLRAQPMAEATRWLAHYQRFWEKSLDALEDLAQQEDP